MAVVCKFIHVTLGGQAVAGTDAEKLAGCSGFQLARETRWLKFFLESPENRSEPPSRSSKGF